MTADLERSISCPRCGAAAVYAGMVGMPANSIYQCNGCGRATWVPAGQPPAQAGGEPMQQQQQEQGPREPDIDGETPKT